MAGPTHYARIYNITGPIDFPSFLKDHDVIAKLKHDAHPSGASVVLVDPESEQHSEYLFINFQPLQERDEPKSPEGKRKVVKRYTSHGGVYAVLAVGSVIDITTPSKRRAFFRAGVLPFSQVPKSSVVTTFAETLNDFNNTIDDKELVDPRIKVKKE